MADLDVIVIGAGVVGLSAAIAARARGMTVTVLDREGPAAGASAASRMVKRRLSRARK